MEHIVHTENNKNVFDFVVHIRVLPDLYFLSFHFHLPFSANEMKRKHRVNTATNTLRQIVLKQAIV
jgi:hypothetical protein